MKFLLKPTLSIPLLALMSCDVFARTGSGEGKGEIGPSRFLIYMSAIFVSLVLNAIMNYKISKRRVKVQKALQRMKLLEPEWDEAKLVKFAKDQFMNIQNLLGMQNLIGLRKALGYKFYLNLEKHIEENIKKGERNTFSQLEINDAFIVDFKNYANDNNDTFTVCFEANGTDQTIRKGKVVLENYSDFREFWTFRKQAGEWKLYEVTQIQGWEKFIDGNLVYEKIKKKSQHSIE